MIKIFIYDDNKERIESLISLFSMSDEHSVVGQAYDCTSAIEDMERTNPDVVLMDINMPNVDGIEGLKKIKTRFPQINVLMQTAYDDSSKIFASLQNGATGYILKNDKPLKIFQAIEEVHNGGAAMNPAIALKVLDYFKPKEITIHLTPKEQKALSLLSEGMSYKMVANAMGVGYATINSHTKNIYTKLHVSSLGEAIAWYYKNLI
jgi:DNA-binding NarL/FixJ family response regulator